MTRLSRHQLLSAVGAHLRSDFVAIGAEETADEVLTRLRATKVEEKIVYFYVLDRQQRLVGVVPTRRLLASPLSRRIGEIMAEKVVALHTSATLQEACEKFIHHRLLALPVVDGERRLLGVIDISQCTDELIDLAERRTHESAFQLIGVHLNLETDHKPWLSFADRFPWLLCNIAGGLLCALLISFYEAYLDRMLALALFIPLVLALSESVSIQSMTITLQQLHGGKGKRYRLWRTLSREFFVALMLGAGAGGAVAAVAGVWKGGGLISLAIGGSIFLSVLSACLLGVAFPTALHILKRNPRVASGPIVLAVADVLTLILYFNLSAWLLGLTR